MAEKKSDTLENKQNESAKKAPVKKATAKKTAVKKTASKTTAKKAAAKNTVKKTASKTAAKSAAKSTVKTSVSKNSVVKNVADKSGIDKNAKADKGINTAQQKAPKITGNFEEKVKQKKFKKQTDDGQAVYNPWVLRIYDIVVTHISNSFVWKCNARHMVKLYAEKIGKNHLDIGVGSGYYLKRLQKMIELDKIHIDIMDLNMNALQYVQRKAGLFDSVLYHHNIFKPIPKDCAGYDSVAINYLLHCIPGTFDAEKSDALGNAVSVLKDGGTLFGATIINADDKSSKMAHKLMATYNKKGIFHNTHDSQESLEKALEKHLHSVKVVRKGSVVLFSGIKK